MKRLILVFLLIPAIALAGTITRDGFIFDEKSEPSSPPATRHHVYVDSSDQRLKIKNSSGTVNEVGDTLSTFTIDSDLTSSSAPSYQVHIHGDQVSGGGSGAVPTSLYVTGDVSGGTFNHFVNGLFHSELQSTVGAYYGMEGRVDAGADGMTGIGALGFTNFDNPVSNSSTTGIGVDARVETGDSGVGLGLLAIGLRAWGKGAATNIDAQFGDGSNSGENGVVSYRGYITDGAGAAAAYMQVNDVVDQLVFDVRDAKLDGVSFWLRDTAGAAEINVRDSSAAVVASIDTDGNIAANGDIVQNGSTSGSITISSPALAGSNSIQWPADSGTVALTKNSRFINQETNNYVTYANGSTTMPFDDTIPQISEGNEFATQAITPGDAADELIIDAVINVATNNGSGDVVTCALFQDSTADALTAAAKFVLASTINQISLHHEMTAGTGSSTTFRVRCGTNTAGSVYVNGTSGSRIFGGVMSSPLTIVDYQP